MFGSRTGLGSGGGRGVWLVLLLLLAAVLVPTACVLWFMNAAVRNERLAVRERLTEAYRNNLLERQRRLDAHWAGRLEALEQAARLPPGEAFEKIVTAGLAAAAVVYDAEGNVAYPSAAGYPAQGPDDVPEAWRAARGLEQAGEPAKAADAYAAIAVGEKQADLRARALQGQARCLARAGRNEQAVEILAGVLAGAEYAAARDAYGRLIAPDALLGALELTPASDPARRRKIAEELAGRLNRYSGPEMSSAQRLFLMDSLAEAAQVSLPTREAQRLAREFLETTGDTRPREGGRVHNVANRYRALVTRDRRVTGLLGAEEMFGALKAFHSVTDIPGTRVDITVMDFGRGGKPFLRLPGGTHAPDWEMSLRLDSPDPFEAATREQQQMYRWTAGVGIWAVVVLALIVGGYLGRQARLARLKNDLIATVSHELKTPLASMRVLVDTLLEGRSTGPEQAREYFALIARENERLSRLIDNFLTFSRMERNKRAFEFESVGVADIVRAAVEAAGERFAAPQATLEVEVAQDIPAIRADRDAMVTVLLNLLDNAWKYSGDEKRVRVRAWADGARVCIEVADNGIGMNRRTLRRVFDRFYQADQTLARKAGGCGLGLSIVKYIVDAHGGSIDAASEPGSGSTFTVRLPAAPAEGGGDGR